MDFLDYVLAFLTNQVLLAAVLSWFVAQVLKVIINAIVNRELSFERLVGDGGMPSGHSATVSATAIMCGWCCGFDSAVFGIAFVLAIIVMHDASGVRREAGKHAVVIKEIAENVNHLVEEEKEEEEQINTDMLKEFVGHTPTQVVVGMILGVLVSILFCVFTGAEYGAGFNSLI